MKIIIPILVSVCFFLIITVKAQNDDCYYYYKDKKIRIYTDSTSAGILTKDTNAVIQILKTKNIKTKITGRLWISKVFIRSIPFGRISSRPYFSQSCWLQS